MNKFNINKKQHGYLCRDRINLQKTERERAIEREREREGERQEYSFSSEKRLYSTGGILLLLEQRTVFHGWNTS